MHKLNRVDDLMGINYLYRDIDMKMNLNQLL